MRVITAPGVEITEIDKSQYSPAMTGTACYVMGFANKGEPYQPMEFTTRAAWTSYYGEPQTEAEKYFYNACVEVLNQNGRLYCSRLPYYNKSYKRMVGFEYHITEDADSKYDYDYRADISAVDPTVTNLWKIEGADNPRDFELSSIDAYSSDELKVTDNHFIVVDKTCAAYNKVQEGTRKGESRELLGIVPVVTTAANALYAQDLIDVEDVNAKYYESIGDIVTFNDVNYIEGGTVDDPLSAANQELVIQLNSTFKNYKPSMTHLPAGYVSTLGGIKSGIDELMSKYGNVVLSGINDSDDTTTAATLVDNHNDLVLGLIYAWEKDPILSANAGILEKLSVDSSIDTIGMFKAKFIDLEMYYTAAGKYVASDGDAKLPDTVSFEANKFFSPIEYDSNLSILNRDNLKKIGIVVFKAYIDPSEGNKIAFEPVEAFCGSLCKDDKDANTGDTTFIDTIVNTNSNYIYFFSNCFNNPADRNKYNDLDMFITTATGTTGSLGFYEEYVKKYISVPMSIYEGMNMCFDKVSDINERDIDIVCDAGVSNIASFIKAVYYGNDDTGMYDLNAIVNGTPVISQWKCDSNNDSVKTWKSVIQKLDNLCKNIRKDCMFITECPRPLVLAGNKKIVRSSKPENTVDACILPSVKYITGLNTNYGAGYMDWFEIADEFTGDFMWLPPSVKAMGAYINTDVNFNYWDAPAGLNRGIIAATDVAFSPNSKQAGSIYEKNWNYAINYPQDGIILEGQKTFQVKPSAFDRINVRRLFLRLERAAYKVARYFVYEGNTAYTRQRLVDALNPYFKEAQVGGGIYDYRIICDESCNTPEVIDRNELKVKIGIKPVKTAEFILIDFIALTTGGSFEEAMA